MRTTGKLTEWQIKTLKPRERPYKVADDAGLYVYVAPAGGRRRDSSVRAIYNRSTRLPERQAMMQTWADYLDALRAS